MKKGILILIILIFTNDVFGSPLHIQSQENALNTIYFDTDETTVNTMLHLMKQNSQTLQRQSHYNNIPTRDGDLAQFLYAMGLSYAGLVDSANAVLYPIQSRIPKMQLIRLRDVNLSIQSLIDSHNAFVHNLVPVVFISVLTTSHSEIVLTCSTADSNNIRLTRTLSNAAKRIGSINDSLTVWLPQTKVKLRGKGIRTENFDTAYQRNIVVAEERPIYVSTKPNLIDAKHDLVFRSEEENQPYSASALKLGVVYTVTQVAPRPDIQVDKKIIFLTTPEIGVHTDIPQNVRIITVNNQGEAFIPVKKQGKWRKISAAILLVTIGGTLFF